MTLSCRHQLDPTHLETTSKYSTAPHNTSSAYLLGDSGHHSHWLDKLIQSRSPSREKVPHTANSQYHQKPRVRVKTATNAFKQASQPHINDLTPIHITIPSRNTSKYLQKHDTPYRPLCSTLNTKWKQQNTLHLLVADHSLICKTPRETESKNTEIIFNSNKNPF